MTIEEQNLNWYIQKILDGGINIKGINSLTDQLILSGSGKVRMCFQMSNADLGKGSSAPTESILGTYTVWEFTVGDDCVFDFEIPHDCDTSEDIEVHVVWCIDEAHAGDEKIKWQVDWGSCPHNETEPLDNPTHTGTDTGEDSTPAVAKHLMETLAGTIPLADIEDDEIIGVKVSRIACTGDTPTKHPLVTDIHFKYVVNKLGEVIP